MNNTRRPLRSHSPWWTLSSRDSSISSFYQAQWTVRITSNSQSWFWMKQLRCGTTTRTQIVGTQLSLKTISSMWPSGWVTLSRQAFAIASTSVWRAIPSTWSRMSSLADSPTGSLHGFKTYSEMYWHSILFTRRSRRPRMPITKWRLFSGMANW